MKDHLPKTDFEDREIAQVDDFSFPGRKSLLEGLELQLGVTGDVWIHHAYSVPSKDPLLIEEKYEIHYQDKIIVPSILHTLIDKVGGKRTTSLANICGMKSPELIFLHDPATMNLSVVFQEKLWITEVLLKQANFLYPAPATREHAMTNLDKTNVEVIHSDISIDLNGHRTERGIEQDDVLIPLDSNYRPILGGKDPASKFKTPFPRLLDAGELVLMISDAISSSAKMYLGTVNVRLNEDKIALEYPLEAHIAGIKLYKKFIDVIEVYSPSQLEKTTLQKINFRIYRSEISRSLRLLVNLLHIR
ncbi:MAG: hypothetical protein ACW98F_02875 [Candidatus Hodarchaeales archaeon]|jgi:hypothetical protein